MTSLFDKGFQLIRASSIQRLRPDGSPFVWAHRPPRKIDWDALYRQALADLRPVREIRLFDLYCALDLTLMRLGDGHSFVCALPHYYRAEWMGRTNPSWEERRALASLAAQRAAARPAQEAFANKPSLSFLPGGILVLSVPGNAWRPVKKRVVEAVQGRARLLEAARHGRVRGMVVDLRENDGGALYPMLHFLSPLLGRGQLGFFRGPDPGTDRGWSVNQSESGLPRLYPKAENFPFLETPVAVLAGKRTGSSGEAVFLSFRGRPHTRSFGAPTNGVSSGNVSFYLYDRKAPVLHICAGLSQDRNAIGDGGPLRPDEKTKKPLEEAVRWLRR